MSAEAAPSATKEPVRASSPVVDVVIGLSPAGEASTNGEPAGRSWPRVTDGDVSVVAADPVVEAFVAVGTLPAALVVTDSQGQARLSNEAWARLTGLGLEASIADGWLGAVPAEDQERLLDAISATAGGAGETALDVRVRRRQGDECFLRWLLTANGHTVLALAVDVDDHHVARARLEERAVRDPLTGLVNRAGLFEVTEQSLRGRRRGEGQAAMLYVDLDGFKAVNDRDGHRAGDRVLAGVGDALSGAVRPDDVVGRVGGDEFAVLCRHVADRAEADTIAGRIRDAVAAPIPVGDTIWQLTASVGVALADDGDESAEALLDRADRAMYAAKRQRTR